MSPVVSKVMLARRPAVDNRSRIPDWLARRTSSARMYPATTSGSSKSSTSARFNSTLPPGRARLVRTPPRSTAIPPVAPVRAASCASGRTVSDVSQGGPATRSIRSSSSLPICVRVTQGTTFIAWFTNAPGSQKISSAATAVADNVAPSQRSLPGRGRDLVTARRRVSMASIICTSSACNCNVSPGSPSG